MACHHHTTSKKCPEELATSAPNHDGCAVSPHFLTSAPVPKFAKSHFPTALWASPAYARLTVGLAIPTTSSISSLSATCGLLGPETEDSMADRDPRHCADPM